MNRLVFALVLLTALPALARPKRRARRKPVATAVSVPAPTPAPPTDSPAPGECAEIQDGLKVCSTIDGRGSFDVVTIPPALVLVSFEDPVTWVNPPPKQYFRADLRENTVTIEPRQKSFPDPTPVVITAGGTVVTLKLHPATGASKVDTQVIVKDPGRRVRDSEIDQRVAERLAPKLKELAERERQLETRAKDRAEGILLEELARSGADAHDPGDSAAARNDAFIVLRVRGRVRVGDRRYLLVALDNRSNEPFELKRVKVWLSEGEAQYEVAASSKFVSTVVRPAEEARGAVFVPLGRKRTAKTRIRIRVEEADPRRSVELAGIEVP
jgi:hypothetical protein